MEQQELIMKAIARFANGENSNRGGQKKLAEALGVTPPFIWQLIQPYGSRHYRKFPLSLAVKLEQVTNGAVTAKQMFPIFFADIF